MKKKMKFKKHTDKVDFMCCLGHESDTPKSWCPKINECQRAIMLRHNQVSENDVVERLCLTNVFEEFMQ